MQQHHCIGDQCTSLSPWVLILSVLPILRQTAEHPGKGCDVNSSVQSLRGQKEKNKWLWMGFFFLLTRITGIQLSHSNQTEGLKITIISLRGWKLKNADEQHPLKLRALLSSPLWRSLTTSHQLDFSFRGVFAARRTACSSLDEAMLTRPVSRCHKIHMLFSLKRMYGQT